MNAYPDSRGLKILFNTFWSTAGWTRESRERFSGADFEYAKSVGLMFDPMSASHAELVANLAAATAQIPMRRVTDAFVASLSTRQLHWRSALGTYTTFRHIRPHAAPNAERVRCDVCGWYGGEDTFDANGLNFERHKWGGVRHSSIEYGAFDLQQFSLLPEIVPTSEDVSILREVLDSLSRQEAGTTSAQLQGRLPKSLRSNKSEREILIGLLGICGILGTAQHPGFLDTFVESRRRNLPDRRFVDMAYPACWWKAEDGINERAVEACFGYLL